MNKKDIIKRLTNTQLDIHERETLSQLLHYLHVEGITHASSNKPKPKYTKKKRTS